MNYSRKFEIAVLLRPLLQKRVQALCFNFGYFVNCRQLNQNNHKYFINLKGIAVSE